MHAPPITGPSIPRLHGTFRGGHPRHGRSSGFECACRYNRYRTKLLGQVGFYTLSEDIFAPIIQIDVMRGYLTTDPVIHTTYVQYQPSQVQSQSVSFVAADYNVTPPPTGLLVYTMYVTALVLDMAEQDQNALMLPYIRIRAYFL